MENVLSLNHRPIGRSTHPRGFAGKYARYVTRDKAVSLVMGTVMETAKWGAAREDVLRANARVCDRIMFAFSSKIPREDRPAIVTAFIEKLTNNNSDQVAWIAGIHDRGKDMENPHVHIMIADRHLQTGMKVWRSGKMGSTEMARRLCEEAQNEALEALGEEPIDRRSYARRGVKTVPTKHLGLKPCEERESANQFNANVRELNALVAELRSLDVEVEKLREERTLNGMVDETPMVSIPHVARKNAAGRIRVPPGPCVQFSPAVMGPVLFEAVSNEPLCSAAKTTASLSSVDASLEHGVGVYGSQPPNIASLVGEIDSEPSVALGACEGSDCIPHTAHFPIQLFEPQIRPRSVASRSVFSQVELIRVLENDLLSVQALLPNGERLSDPYNSSAEGALAQQRRMSGRLEAAKMLLPEETLALRKSNVFSLSKVERRIVNAKKLRIAAAVELNAVDVAKSEEEQCNAVKRMQNEWRATYKARADREQLAKIQRRIHRTIKRLRETTFYELMAGLEIPDTCGRSENVDDLVRDRLERINAALDTAPQRSLDTRTMRGRERTLSKEDLTR